MLVVGSPLRVVREEIIISLLVEHKVVLALQVYLSLFFKPLLGLGPDLPLFLIEAFALFVDFAEFLFDIGEQLLVSDDHKVPEEDELDVVGEYIADILRALLLDCLAESLPFEPQKIFFQQLVCPLAGFDFLFAVLVGQKLAKELLQ